MPVQVGPWKAISDWDCGGGSSWTGSVDGGVVVWRVLAFCSQCAVCISRINKPSSKIAATDRTAIGFALIAIILSSAHEKSRPFLRLVILPGPFRCLALPSGAVRRFARRNDA